MSERIFNIAYTEYNSDGNFHYDVYPGVTVKATKETVEAFITRVNKAFKVLKSLHSQVFPIGSALSLTSQLKLETQLKAEGLYLTPVPKGGAAMSAKEHQEHSKAVADANAHNRGYYAREQVLESQIRMEVYQEQVAEFDQLVKESLADYEKEVELIFVCLEKRNLAEESGILYFEAKETRSFNI